MTDETLLSVMNIKKWFPIDDKLIGTSSSFVKAVDGVSFSVKRNEVLGLVGESGCGKTTVSRVILGLTPASEGEIFFDGKNLTQMKKKETRKMRSKMQIVFQDPHSSLSPRMSIYSTIAEPMEIQRKGTRADRIQRVYELLETVGLEKSYAWRYPHEFSGGQRQRIGIARVLAADPEFIICDEPVSALDVSIRSQILNLLMELKEKFCLTMLFISHDLSVVEYICDRIIVMYLGRITEMAPKKNLFNRPSHPYTKALISAIPIPSPNAKKDRIILEGDMPSPINPPDGCRFHTRCVYAKDICKKMNPELQEVEPGHEVACHFAKELFNLN